MKEFQTSSSEKTEATEWDKLATWTKRFIATIAVATLAVQPIQSVNAASQEVFQQNSLINESQSIYIQSAEQDSPDVYNGREPSPEEKAFSVLVYTSNGRGSGFIKDAYTIISAEHVVNDLNADFVDVVLDGDPSRQRRKVNKIIKIAQDIYNENDQVALILAEPIIFTETIQPVPIGHSSMLSEFPLFIEGHGGSEEGNFNSNPKVGDQTLYPLYACRWQNMIFTKNVDLSVEGPIPFFGDSGGPLYVHVDKPFYVEEEDKTYLPGYYVMAVLTKFCSEIVMGQNGEPDPYITMGYHSLVDSKIADELAKIELIAPSFIDRKLYIPQIGRVEDEESIVSVP